MPVPEPEDSGGEINLLPPTLDEATFVGVACRAGELNIPEEVVPCEEMGGRGREDAAAGMDMEPEEA
jgi:hypothetical protein